LPAEGFRHDGILQRAIWSLLICFKVGKFVAQVRKHYLALFCVLHKTPFFSTFDWSNL